MCPHVARLAALLAANGFVSAEEEASLLVAAAGDDEGRLDAMVQRRLTGEPLAWITGGVSFCGVPVRVDPGVYVPRAELAMLQRDTFTFETPLAYDGGEDGAGVLRRVLREGVDWLRPGGAMLLELGGSQASLLGGELAALGYGDVAVLADEDGDVRGIEATLRA